MIAAADLLANVERPQSERPPPIPPPLPDRESPEPFWQGGAAAYVNGWRTRALRAEAELARLGRGKGGGR
jgi:hypothetical protein